VLLVTSTLVVEVHPFAGSVTVTVYVPAAFTDGVSVDAPTVMPTPAQLYVAPVVVELTEIIPLEGEHPNASVGPADTAGGVVLDETLTVCCDEHPVSRSVIVKV